MCSSGVVGSKVGNEVYIPPVKLSLSVILAELDHLQGKHFSCHHLSSGETRHGTRRSCFSSENHKTDRLRKTLFTRGQLRGTLLSRPPQLSFSHVVFQQNLFPTILFSLSLVCFHPAVRPLCPTAVNRRCTSVLSITVMFGKRIKRTDLLLWSRQGAQGRFDLVLDSSPS